MSSAYIVTTPVSTEPLALSDAKAYLRVDFTDDDTVIQNLITRARSLCETLTGRAFATQTITQTYMIERPIGGELSGPISPGANWYQFQEALGANPFGPAMYYFDLAMPPFQSLTSVMTKVTVFDTWQAFTSTNYVDTIREPARIYFQDPITANMWQFIYTCGYSSGYPLPPDLLQALYEGVAYLYEFREAQDFPQALKDKLFSKRVDWV